jgi:glycerol-3-phosphate acyltransferase PlsY
MGSVLLAGLLGYLVGSFPTSILTARFLKGIDIREHGSGNAGGTNVLRILGWKAGVFVMIVDVLKGVVAAGIVPLLFAYNSEWFPIWTGLCAVAGHVWTIFAGFHGGKGVGTAAGMLIVLYPVAFTACLVWFLLIAFTTRYVSLASITAAILLPVILLAFDHFGYRPVPEILFWFAIFIAVFIVFTHRENIKRLSQGRENRFGKN